jgi:uncharacterized membrane protein YoaK (UPF0700 family)
MTIEQKALLETFKFIGSIILGAIGMLIIGEVFGQIVVTWILLIALIVFFSYMFYTYNLEKLKYDERTREQRKEPNL